jgi:hypothetical protein
VPALVVALQELSGAVFAVVVLEVTGLVVGPVDLDLLDLLQRERSAMSFLEEVGL